MDSLQAIFTAAAAAVNSPVATQIAQVLTAVINAAPAIERGVVAAEPYISAIILVVEGKAPTGADWDDTVARLDAGSKVLADAADEEDNGGVI